MKQSMALVNVNALFFPGMVILIGLSTLLTIYVGGRETIGGSMTAGNIAEFIIYINMITWPFATLGWVTSLIERASASQQRINEFLHTIPAIRNENHDEIHIRGEVCFENISFTYPGANVQALKDISFTLKAGQSLAILGRTGSGKSTVAHLLLRLYDADSGNIAIDGIPIRKINLDALRKQSGYVPQDVFLFSDTIRNNISFGLPKDQLSDEDRIILAAKNAAVYDNIMAFPEHFDTVIGERGITLSGGQKQRVSIARAIVKDPSILIFDDCLSAVDTHTEETILRNLRTVMKKKTTLIISHRVSSVKNADRILVMEDGSIAEEGNHQELMQRDGLYAAMMRKQLESDAAALSGSPQR